MGGRREIGFTPVCSLSLSAMGYVNDLAMVGDEGIIDEDGYLRSL